MICIFLRKRITEIGKKKTRSPFPLDKVVIIIISMKRTVAVFLLLLTLFSLNARIEIRDDLFSSEEELASFQAEEVTADEESYYDGMKIYLLTGGEGSAIWENFGHSAFVIEMEGAAPVAFDYGIFTFDETFLPNFILGKLYYQVWETYAVYRIESLKEDDRSVSLLELDLTNNQKKALFSFLIYNTEEENRTYLYDYFNDNCATRLRDIYSYVTGGEFETWLKGQESGETIRYGVARHLSRSTFFSSWIINYMLGSSVDRKITRWEECYLPANLEKAIEEYQNTQSEAVYTTMGRKSTPQKWSLELCSLVFGLALAVISFLSYRYGYQKVWDIILALVFTLFSLMSLILIFFELFTIHYVTHSNLNVFIITPLCIISAILHFASLGCSHKGERNMKEERIRKNISRTGIIMLSVSVLTVLLRLILSSILIQNIWAPAITAILLYSAEALPFFLKRENR